MPFTVPNIFNVTIAVISNSKGYFQRTTALSKSQATAAERRGRRCTSFLTRHWRGQTCTSRDYQGEVAGKEQPTEGYFRFRKFASKGCDD